MDKIDKKIFNETFQKIEDIINELDDGRIAVAVLYKHLAWVLSAIKSDDEQAEAVFKQIYREFALYNAIKEAREKLK